MQNGRSKNRKTGPLRQAGSYLGRSAGTYAGKSRQWSSPPRVEPKGSHNAQKHYDRYLVLAQTEAQAGNRIAAENYYQHAEHFLRTMRSDSGAS
jgi:hypothetical protein